jgi:hypothetical protein
MKQFIEVPQKEGNVLINVSHIFLVEKRKGGTRMSLDIKGHNDFPYQYIETPLTYEQVTALIQAAL